MEGTASQLRHQLRNGEKNPLVSLVPRLNPLPKLHPLPLNVYVVSVTNTGEGQGLRLRKMYYLPCVLGTKLYCLSTSNPLWNVLIIQGIALTLQWNVLVIQGITLMVDPHTMGCPY